MKKIPVGGDKYALVDDELFEELSRYRWRMVKGYVTANIPLHRLIMKAPRLVMVDHKDRNPLNNRCENLRFATPAQNKQNCNKQRNLSSWYLGVSRRKDRKQLWRAAIRHNNKWCFIGDFKEERYAAMARDMWALHSHGEFSNLNFNVICSSGSKKEARP